MKKSYQIVTPTGRISSVYEDKDLALDRFKNAPDSWRIEEVVTTVKDITPKGHNSRSLRDALIIAQRVYIGSGAVPTFRAAL